ncbi:MAG: hypothetical protein KG003_07635 [Bacteroidetes bacterium]|nr:hypothetical protein [Bacteroidota bacterium]
MAEVSTEGKTKQAEAQASSSGGNQGSGNAKVVDPKVAGAEASAKKGSDSKPVDYDEYVANLNSEKKVEGGEQVIASGLDKGRLVKDDGSIDYESPSHLEKRLGGEFDTIPE